MCLYWSQKCHASFLLTKGQAWAPEGKCWYPDPSHVRWPGLQQHLALSQSLPTELGLLASPSPPWGCTCWILTRSQSKGWRGSVPCRSRITHPGWGHPRSRVSVFFSVMSTTDRWCGWLKAWAGHGFYLENSVLCSGEQVALSLTAATTPLSKLKLGD